ncbi:NAD(P)-dependent alcohol dehydrogenase [Devosia sp.]|uniref:NAD(P)-dependent alcohol dehydrogenase n=1 Tax=Devosia sp. TaxID=1871048 RepID=UPI002F05761C
MKAVLQRAYGTPDVLALAEVPQPLPRDNEVLVRIRATTVTSGDARMRSFTVPAVFWLPGRLAIGITRPRKPVPGVEFAGEVEAVGRAVTRFRPGDAVFGLDVGGCHAEYKCVPETAAIALKPQTLGFEEAAALPFGGLTALHFLRAGGIRAGSRVLINGASGAVGVAAVQLARHFGADITGVCSTANLDLVRSLGAGSTLDYTKADVPAPGAVYDIIFDTVGTLSFGRCRASLAPDGRYLAAVMGLAEIGQMLWTSIAGGPRVIGGVAGERREDVETLRQLVEAGALRPVIDSRYRLDDIAAAHARVDSGRKRGSVVIAVDG